MKAFSHFHLVPWLLTIADLVMSNMHFSKKYFDSYVRSKLFMVALLKPFWQRFVLSDPYHDKCMKICTDMKNVRMYEKCKCMNMYEWFYTISHIHFTWNYMKLMKRISFGSIVPGPYICQRSLRIIHHTSHPLQLKVLGWSILPKRWYCMLLSMYSKPSHYQLIQLLTAWY